MSRTHHILQELVIVDLASTTDNVEERFFKFCDPDNILLVSTRFPLKY